MRTARVARISIACLGFSASSIAQQREIKTPREIEFKAPFRTGGPDGATPYGDPNKPGLYVTRVRFTPGQKNMLHWHQDARTVVVLSGTYYFAYGEKIRDGLLSFAAMNIREQLANSEMEPTLLTGSRLSAGAVHFRR